MLFAKTARQQHGFNLIDFLTIVGMIALVLGILFIIINPQRHFERPDNTQRETDVNALLNAVVAYTADKGELPKGAGGVDIPITPAPALVIGSGKDQIDLCDALVPMYIPDIPLDPSSTVGLQKPDNSICTDDGATYSSGYTIKTDPNQIVTISAPSARGGAITVTR